MKKSKLGKRKDYLKLFVIFTIIISCLFYIIHSFNASDRKIQAFIHNSVLIKGGIISKRDYSYISKGAAKGVRHYFTIRYYNKLQKKYYKKEIFVTDREYNRYHKNDTIKVCFLEKQNEIMSKMMLKRYKKDIRMDYYLGGAINIIIYCCIVLFSLIALICLYSFIFYDNIKESRKRAGV